MTLLKCESPRSAGLFQYNRGWGISYETRADIGEYVRTSAGWVRVWGPIETAVLTPASGITIASQSLTKQNGMVTLNLRVTGTIFSGTLLSALPVGFRPVAAILPPASAILGSTPYAAASQIITNGEVYGYTPSSAAYSFGISCSYLAAP